MKERDKLGGLKVNELTVIRSENFGAVTCDFLKDANSEIWMTRRQIGEALEYIDPAPSIKNIHLRHKERLDKFSMVVQLDTPSRGEQETTIYSAKGIYEICRWSQQPKADKFYDWVYEILEGLRKGNLKLIQVPQSLPEALRLAADLAEKNMKLEEQNRKMLPKVEFFDQVAESRDAIEIGDAAKVLNIGLGRNRLFKILRSKGILMSNNIPYQEYIDRGYFRTIEQKWTTTEGETRINIKTLVYQKGLNYIMKIVQAS